LVTDFGGFSLWMQPPNLQSALFNKHLIGGFAMTSDIRSAIRHRLATEAPQLLNREEAAAYLGGIKPQTLAAWQSTGRYKIPVVKVGRCCRYRKADLDRFIAARTVGDFDAE